MELPALRVGRHRIHGITASLLVTILGLGSGCGGGGGGGSGDSFDDQAELLAVLFPDPENVNPEPEEEWPQAAPLVQSIELHFSGRPDPDRVSRDTVPIRDLSGRPVLGSYRVEDRVVTFTPRLPTREARLLTENSFDNGGAGLEPLSIYSLRVGARTFSFVTSISDALREHAPDPTDPNGVLISFGTTGNIEDFFRGVEARRPRLVSSDPVDGAVDFTPELYTDPEGLFAPRASLQLHFDAPVHPAAANLERFLLIDVDERTATSPAGIALGIDLRVLRNELDGSTIELTPSGILPFGHFLSLEHPTDLVALSETNTDPGPESTVAATFTVAGAPDLVRDALVEDFDDTERREDDSTQIQIGELFADWDSQNSNVLQASFAFEGGGELGRFVPSPPIDSQPKTVVLDTSYQSFPLFDGSTPDAPAGFEVVGGVFPFTDIDIPADVYIEVRGPNTFVLTATGSVRIAGEIHAYGRGGTPENAFDSAVTSVPGGSGRAGGGRGGEGQPIFYYPSDEISHLTLVSPQYAGSGWGPGNTARTGGQGGQCGLVDRPTSKGEYGTDSEIDCLELVSTHNNGYKPPGGGGGSMLAKGKSPKKNGIGNVLADGIGGYVVRTPDTHKKHDRLLGGPGGERVFVDANPDNDFIGVHGEHRSVFGGQGGGAGGSALDSYFCGEWCLYDQDSTNDALCQAEFGNPPTYAGAVGDARGGSAGAGGGAVVIKALGDVTVSSRGRINCRGGTGGGGEMLGCGAWSGGGGGGSGGAIVIQSAISIVISKNATLDVANGGPGLATKETNYAGGGCPGTRRDDNIGAGGYGGHGIIQLQVPIGQTATVRNGANLTSGAWVDQENTLNPAEFSSVSVAISSWFDLGRVIVRPPEGTNPLYSFGGLDASGVVITDAEGNVVDPDGTNIRCDYLGQLDPLNPGQYLPGQEPRSNFIPTNADITLAFQGAHAIVEGSKEVDPNTITDWSPSVSVASGRQFVRYRVSFDIGANGKEVGPFTPLPAVQSVRVDAEF